MHKASFDTSNISQRKFILTITVKYWILINHYDLDY